jgi:hypothetical protein
MNTRYPGYDVLSKWNSPSFDDTTREVLGQRLHAIPGRRFLTEEEWQLLEAVNQRLLPQPDRAEPIPITPWIDAMLRAGIGEGYRRPDMPPLRVTWRHGLAALDDEAQRRHAQGFIHLDAEQQDALIHALTEGQQQSPRWSPLSARHFVVHQLLKTAAGIYYSHPAAWNEIGFGGPASPRGYVRLGLDQRDAWEAGRA